HATAANGRSALEIGRALIRAHIDMMQDRHGDDLVVLIERDTAHTHRGAAREHAHVSHRKADALAAGGGEQHIVLLGADLHINNGLTFFELHRDDAGAAHVGEIRELVAAYVAA